MVHDVRSVLGYHGNQLGRYNGLLGLDEDGRQIGNPNMWALTNARFWLTNTDSLPIPGSRRVVGPVRNAAGTTVYLYALPGENPLAWLTPVIVKAPDDQVLSTILDARFDVRRAALFDTGAAVSARTVTALPEAPSGRVTTTRYEPGRISLSLDTAAPEGSALIVSENYYAGWKATANGQPARLGRADYSLIGVELPAGTRTVDLTFDSPPYHTGKTVTLLALLASAAWAAVGLFAERRTRV
jgi:hypothetical protein